MAILKVQTAGLPVISSYYVNVSDVVWWQNALLPSEQDIGALAGRIEHLIEHPELCSKMDTQGQRFVE